VSTLAWVEGDLRPRTRFIALAVIAVLAGLSYLWASGQDMLEFYYEASVRSMSLNWHNFIFGAMDPAGTITLSAVTSTPASGARTAARAGGLRSARHR